MTGRPGDPARWRWRARRLPGRLRAELRLVGEAAWRGLRRLLNSEDFTFASSIGYYALLSLFPLFLLLFAVLGLLTTDPTERRSVVEFVLRYFPGQFDFVMRQLESLQRTRVELGVAGGAAITWAALGVFRAVTSAVNHAWGVEKQRTFLKHQLVAFVMLLCAGALLMVALLLAGATDITQAGWFVQLRERIPALYLVEVVADVAFRFAPTLIFIFVVGLIFFYVPNAKVRFRDVWLGAVMTGLLWRGALAGFSWYLRDPDRLSIHGSIATVVAFLFWVYITAIILLYGVEFTAAYARLRRHRPASIPAAASPRT